VQFTWDERKNQIDKQKYASALKQPSWRLTVLTSYRVKTGQWTVNRDGKRSEWSTEFMCCSSLTPYRKTAMKKLSA
jgi:hypothetical protein